MKQYRVNLSDVETREEFYIRIIKGLKFPDWCGKNPDAIWDMLTGYMEHDATVYIEGLNSLTAALENDVKILYRILEEAVKLYEGKLKVEFIS